MASLSLKSLDRRVSAIESAQKSANATGVIIHLPAAVQLAKAEVDLGITRWQGELGRLILVGGSIDGIKPGSWSEAMDWAMKEGLSLPSRFDALVLFEKARDRFKTDLPYWTCEQYAGGHSYAWYQWFSYGNQSYWHKDGKNRACLVRRIAIR